jgi:predicted TPR repeat methyltransferase
LRVSVDKKAEVERLFALALGHFRGGRVQEAEKLCRTVLSLEPRHAQCLHLLGVIAAHDGRNDDALELIGNAIAADGAVPEFHNSLGNTLAALGRREDAIAAYRQALALAPGYAPSRLNLGNALREKGSLDEAAEQYRHAVALQPDNMPALMNLGIVLATRGEFDNALTTFERVLSRHPDLPEANFHLGHVLAELGRPDEAIARYREVLRIRPDNALAYNGLGNVFQQQGKVGEAVAQYRHAVELLPNSAKLRIDLGLALIEDGKRDEAIAQSEAAASLADQPQFPHFLLGVLLARCGLKEAARARFETYLRLEPNDARGARMCLAALGFGTPPDRASSDLLRELYVLRAGWWDRGPGASQNNLWARLVHRTFDRLARSPETLHVLDAGCGSGVIGTLIGQKVARLVGVDLSPGLIERARETKVYHELYQDDLVTFMSTRPETFDVVTSSAVLVHFGDLAPVFDAAAETLRDDGLFIFTVFDNQDDENAVAVGSMDRGYAQTGCYVHGRAYVVRNAVAHRFSVEFLDREIFDHYEGKPRQGLIVALRRTSRGPVGKRATG